MNLLLDQFKQRRIALGLKQHDMMMRVGISRQQYQRLESKGNPRLETLSLVAKGLNSELMLIPQEKLAVVKAVLAGEYSNMAESQPAQIEEESLADNPWKGMFKDEE